MVDSEVKFIDVRPIRDYACPDIRLSERKKAAEKINSVFGWNVTYSTGETVKDGETNG